MTTRYAIQAQAKGEEFYVRAHLDFGLRLQVRLVPMSEPGDTYPTQAAAERWAQRVALVAPALPLQVVPVEPPAPETGW